jgi:hypothetical protein
MREVVFRVVTDHPGRLVAQAETLPLQIAAPTHEELQHEAREALIQHLGPAHVTYRVRLLRQQRQPLGSRHPAGHGLSAAPAAATGLDRQAVA